MSLIPQDFIKQHNLKELVDSKGYVLIEISKGMCSLPQAGRIASDFLLPRLKAAGYHPTARTPGLFRHESNSVTFCLVVDDFGVKYTNKADAEHLYNTLTKHYTITTDWEGTNYCGCLLYTSPSPRDQRGSRMPSSA